MMLADCINGLYEAGGGFMNLLNVRALYKDKKVRGVKILPSMFFTSWGIWNLYYYPHLGQWISFIGGLAIVVANIAWVSLAVYYSRKESGLKKACSVCKGRRVVARCSSDVTGWELLPCLACGATMADVLKETN